MHSCSETHSLISSILIVYFDVIMNARYGQRNEKIQNWPKFVALYIWPNLFECIYLFYNISNVINIETKIYFYKWIIKITFSLTISIQLHEVTTLSNSRWLDDTINTYYSTQIWLMYSFCRILKLDHI